MVNFGQWNQFIDMSVFAAYGGKYPGDLGERIKQYTPHADDFKPLADPVHEKLFREFKQWVDSSIPIRFPDHNSKHFQEVHDRVLELFDRYYGVKAKREYLAVRQALQYLAYGHDCKHCGATLIVDAEPRWRPKGYGTEVTLEWVSASEVVAFGIKHGFSLPFIVFMAAGILATTFGAEAARERRLNWVPAIESDHPITCMIRAADSYPMESLVEFIEKGADVHIGEIPPAGRAESYVELIQRQEKFLGYVQLTQSRLDRVCKGVATSCDWTDNTSQLIKGLRKLIAGEDPKTEKRIKNMLRQRYRITA